MTDQPATDQPAKDQPTTGLPVAGQPVAGQPGVAPYQQLDPKQDEIAIRLPARSIYVAVVRTAIAGVAARCDFTVEEIEDLRIAVDEACGLLLADVAPGSMLWCHFVAKPDSLVAAVSARVVNPVLPDTSSFGWLVLNALVGVAQAQVDGDVMTIMLSRTRDAATS